jgi:hypothetical protein
MFVELTTPAGQTKSINAANVLWYSDENTAGPEAQPVVILTVKFVNGSTEKFVGTKTEAKAKGLK